MSAWIQQSSPRPGDQWRPIPLDNLEKIKREEPVDIASELEKLKREITDKAKSRIRDEDIRKAEKLYRRPRQRIHRRRRYQPYRT